MIKQKILFVDDEENILNTIKRNLMVKRNEWELYFAKNGAEGISISLDIIPDLIVTDARMPEMNGAEFLLELQRHEKTKEIPTIMLTGFADNEIRKQALEAGIIANSHHEKWNGLGYPNGLKENDIPIEGRIVAVADIFDALSSKRHYKPAFSIEKCISIINELSGSHLDPSLVNLFNENLDKFIAVMNRFKEKE